MPAPYFCFNNLLRDATIVSQATIANFGFANALDGRTSTQCGLATGATRDIVVDFTSAQEFTHFGIANHNLNGATLTIAGSSDNTTYVDIEEIAFTNNYVLTVEFSAASYRYVRFRFEDLSNNVYFSDIFLGDALELSGGIPVGFVPPEYSDQDAIDTNMTGNGAIAGINITTKPKVCKLSLNDYEYTWFDSNWLAFVTSAKVYPFYFLWKDGRRAMYCVIDKKIGDVSYTYHNRQSVTLTLEGFIE